jgi:hypothetical protein
VANGYSITAAGLCFSPKKVVSNRAGCFFNTSIRCGNLRSDIDGLGREANAESAGKSSHELSI